MRSYFVLWFSFLVLLCHSSGQLAVLNGEYTISNMWKGDGPKLTLDVDTYQLSLQPYTAHESQFWKIVSHKTSVGYYRIISSLLGDSKSLNAQSRDVFNFDDYEDYSGFWWQLSNHPSIAGYYRITNMWLEDGISLAAQEDNSLRLESTADYSGHWWKFSPLDRSKLITPRGGNRVNASFTTVETANFEGNWRLVNLRDGTCVSLALSAAGLVMEKTDDYSGQHWTIKSISQGTYQIANVWQSNSNLGVHRNRQITVVNDVQLWKLFKHPTKSKSYQLVSVKKPGHCLTINGGKTLSLQPNRSSEDQYWVLIPEKRVSSPPISLNLNSFYKKYLDADGIPIVSSAAVPDAALHRARYLTIHMVSQIPQATIQMRRNRVKVAVMGKDEYTTTIPEHSFLAPEYWNQRARGLGGTIEVPTSTCAEENLLCYDNDPYVDEDIFIHEFAHTIHLTGLKRAFSSFQSELDEAFENAKSKGLFNNTYAMENVAEYFAEGVQDWFNVNDAADPPNGIHNRINTREELRTYDVMLYRLLFKYFPKDSNRCSCHETV